jgi:hypothetical protein
MTKQDRQKLGILGVLLLILGLTVLLGYQLIAPQTAVTMQPAETKTSSNPPAPSEAYIRLDLLEESQSDEQEVGKRNLFQYRQAPAPPAPPRGAPAGLPSTTMMPPVQQNPGPTGPTVRPPQPIPLKYQGYAVTPSPDGGLTAFLSDDIRHYNVVVGEILMGRYRIVSINDKTVEVEDLENSRRQTLPLLK